MPIATPKRAIIGDASMNMAVTSGVGVAIAANAKQTTSTHPPRLEHRAARDQAGQVQTDEQHGQQERHAERQHDPHHERQVVLRVDEVRRALRA